MGYGFASGWLLVGGFYTLGPLNMPKLMKIRSSPLACRRLFIECALLTTLLVTFFQHDSLFSSDLCDFVVSNEGVLENEYTFSLDNVVQ